MSYCVGFRFENRVLLSLNSSEEKAFLFKEKHAATFSSSSVAQTLFVLLYNYIMSYYTYKLLYFILQVCLSFKSLHISVNNPLCPQRNNRSSCLPKECHSCVRMRRRPISPLESSSQYNIKYDAYFYWQTDSFIVAIKQICIITTKYKYCRI